MVRIYATTGLLDTVHPTTGFVTDHATAGVVVTDHTATGNDAAWDDYVTRSPEGTPFHLSSWSRAVARTFRHRPAHLRAERGGATVGVLPLFHVKSRLFGSMLISTPNAVYGGSLADDPETHRALIAAAKRKAIDANVDYLELRHRTDIETEDSELRTKDLYVAFDQPIGGDDEAMLRRWPSDIRRMIRIGAKSGFECQVGRGDRLDDFYQCYATSVRALGTPVFPKKLFSELLEAFPDTSDILVLRHEGRVAAAVMSFYFGGAVLPYYAGAYAEFYRGGVNNFMYWQLIRHAAGRGCTRFDFGRSKVDTGAYAFKKGWRMRERALPYRYFLVRAREVPNLNPTNPRFALLIRAWKQLPLRVTTSLGPLVVKHLP
jgi:FemAB-related protein (PEP-CTERM system-associated)